jgi:cell shape-determining protein MreC
MYYRRLRKPSKPTVFAMLIAVSALMVLLPREYLAPARNMTQLAALPQYAVNSAARGMSQSANALRTKPVSAREHDELLKAKQAAENENVSLRQQLALLQDQVGQLRSLRSRAGFPQDAKLIPARVVAWDAVPGRDSMVLLKGRSGSVQQGDWVASNLAVQAGQENGIRDDLRVLASETLIGWIEQTAPYVSRVVLLSDTHANRKWRVHVVAVGRHGRENEFVRNANQELAAFAMEGIGNGQMRLLDVDARYIREGAIREGDVVTTDGHDPKLPVTMVIGEIVEFTQIQKQPLLYNATIKHRCPPKDISEVFIVDTPR